MSCETCQQRQIWDEYFGFIGTKSQLSLVVSSAGATVPSRGSSQVLQRSGRRDSRCLIFLWFVGRNRIVWGHYVHVSNLHPIATAFLLRLCIWKRGGMRKASQALCGFGHSERGTSADVRLFVQKSNFTSHIYDLYIGRNTILLYQCF